MRLKKGILFAPDAVFKGKPRELVADDYVYSLKRLADPKIRSPWAFLVEGKFQSASTSSPRRRRRAGASTTTARSPGSRRSTGTRCASG